MNRCPLVAVGAGVLVAVMIAACGDDRSHRVASRAPGPLDLAREPYMGIACGRANSVSSARACDRVGLAVWLNRPAGNVAASIAGHRLTLRDTGDRGERLGYWEAFLHPAGLDDGPLILPRRHGDYWAGEPAVSAPVRITVQYTDGATASTRQRVRLEPGYG
ncbi:MAG: hypothetical protein ACRDMH_11005 [Solirubrobacterales bacterium]